MNKYNRNKAFLGAVIGLATNVIGGAISANKKKKAEEAAYKQQQEEQNRKDAINQAQVMSQAYSNQDYIDEYKKKITLKNGGKINMNNKYNDRIKRIKKYSCGGRNKYACGGKKKALFGTEMDNKIGSEIGAASAGIGTLADSLFESSTPAKQVKSSDGFNMNNKTNLTPNSYNNTNNNQYMDIVQQMKMGGCRNKKKRK